MTSRVEQDDAVIVTDLVGRIVDWNGEASQVFGYAAEEVLGRNHALLYCEGDTEAAADDLRAIANGLDYLGLWRGRHKSGAPVQIVACTTLLRDTDGQPTGFIGRSRSLDAWPSDAVVAPPTVDGVPVTVGDLLLAAVELAEQQELGHMRQALYAAFLPTTNEAAPGELWRHLGRQLRDLLADPCFGPQLEDMLRTANPARRGCRP